MASSQNKRVLALMHLPENSLCADCRAKDPRWASSKLGVFICINCSGIHRGLGTHITFVRSCTLDTWKPEEVDVMERVGNKKGNEYWEARLPPDFVRPRSEDVDAMSKFIRQKYEYKKWIDPLMRPPQLPENVPWEPDPPKTDSDMPTDQNNQMPNEPPRRRKRKKIVNNQNMPEEPFNNNMNFQDENPLDQYSYNEPQNNKNKFSPQNNISLQHDNDGPSSDSLIINSNHQYNPNNKNNHAYEDNGFDPFSGKPLSKEQNYNPDEETDESDPTFADKLIGFIQNGIDFIKEKTKVKKKTNIPSSSGKMSENPRIPKQESFDALHPQHSNRPRFDSFEQQHYQQQSQFHDPPPPPPPQQHQQQQLPPQNNQSNSHSNLGMNLSPQNQQQPSNDVFSLLSGSDVIIDDSQNNMNQINSQPNQIPQQPQQPPPNPFLTHINTETKQDDGNLINNEPVNETAGSKGGFNPFTNQLPADSNNKEASTELVFVSDTNNASNDLIGLDFTSNTTPSSPPQAPSNSDDLLSLDLTSQPISQTQSQNQSYASDLFGLDVTSPDENQIQKQQDGSNNLSPPPQIRSSAYDVFGRPGVGSQGFGSSQPGIGSLGLSPQQQQIAARAVLAAQGSQRGTAQLAAYGSGSSGFMQTGSTGSFTRFNITSSPVSSQPNLQNTRANKSGSGNLGHSSNDPFSGMNPF